MLKILQTAINQKGRIYPTAQSHRQINHIGLVFWLDIDGRSSRECIK